MTIRICVALLALVMLAAAPAKAAEPFKPGPASDGFFYETRSVTDRIHVIVRPDPVRIPAEGNVEVIEQSDGLVVIDAGGTPLGGRRIIEKIRAISPKPVKVLIYTHWHGDHHLGASAFRAAWPKVRIISTAATRAAMTGEPMKYLASFKDQPAAIARASARFQNDPAMDAEAKARWAQAALDAPLTARAYEEAVVVPADETFTDRLELPDARAPLQVLFLGRANTDGDAVVWAPKQRVLITGDIVVAPYPYGTDSYPAEWIAVLKKLKAYDIKYLLPGHGGAQTDRAYLDLLIATLEDLRAEVGPLAKAGVPLAEVQKQVTLEKEARQFGPDSAWIRQFFNLFFVRSMVTNAYKEALGQPITQ